MNELKKYPGPFEALEYLRAELADTGIQNPD
jgi:hypothetical protein